MARFGVYLHVPYCAARCGYCDFNTYVPGEAARGEPEDWLDSVRADLAWQVTNLDLSGLGPVDTVFFGGGTPTHLPPATLGAALSEVADHLGLVPGAEVTVEANPESVDEADLADLRAAGLNRLSVGVQNLDVDILQVLDRKHTPKRVNQVVEWARQAGFTSLSLDLIYGTPGESKESWQRTLTEVLALGPDHVSAYSLIVEPGTPIARRIKKKMIAAPNPDYQADAYELADELLQEAGFRNYEISNWARPGHECVHNQGYWLGGDWLGVGPGAHGSIRSLRYENLKLPRKWGAAVQSGASPISVQDYLSEEQLRLERIMLGIRVPTGVAAADVSAAASSELERRGLITAVADRWVLTKEGRLLADGVAVDLAAN